MEFEGILSFMAGLVDDVRRVTVVTDDNLRCRWANKIALEKFPTLALPDGLLDLAPNVNKNQVLRRLRKGETFTAFVGGEVFDRLVLTMIPFVENGKFLGCIATISNIREVASSEGETSLEDIFTAFTGSFRMPLTIIFSTLGLLSRELSDTAHTQVTDCLRLITQNCYRLLRLSNNLAEISRYRAGEGKIEPQNGDICAFLTGLCNGVSVLASSLNIPLEAEIPEGSIILPFDPEKLSSAMLNLFSNSFKFTREGNRVHVKLEQKEEQVVISVSDRGQGIAAGRLPYIFSPYVAFDPKGQSFGGLGLGLSRVRYIIKMHGGTVAAHSREGEGTTVAFTLPLRSDLSLQDYLSSTGTEYLADRFSPIYIELSDVCRTPLP